MALPLVDDVLQVWWATQQFEGAPPLSGGVWDEWPARLVDGLAVCKREMAAVRAYLMEEAKRHG